VRAALPTARSGREYLIVQRIGEGGVPHLDPKIRARIDLTAWHTDDGVEHPGFANRNGELAFTLLPSQSAVNLPMSTSPTGLPCYSGNQSRAAIALWLAAQALDLSTAAALLDPQAEMGDTRGESWSSSAAPWALTRWDDKWSTDIVAPVAWASADLAVARELSLRPHAAVLRALHSDWQHLTAPSTPTSELVAKLRLTPVSSVESARVPAGLQPCG
jgi:hypothetical protein